MHTPTQKQLLTAQDLYDIKILTNCQIAPNGKHIVYSVQETVRKTEKKYSNLYLTTTKKAKTKRLTKGKYKDVQAIWSPDGQKIAFLSNRDDEKQAQIYLISVTEKKNKPLCLTKLKGSIGKISWSPDGKKILFAFRPTDQEKLERDSNKRAKKMGIVCRHYTEIFYRYDGAGYLPKNKWGISELNIKSGKIKTWLESQTHHHTAPTYSPDGRCIAFIRNQTDRPNLNLYEDQIYILDTENAEIQQITNTKNDKSNLSFSPDGKWLAFIAQREPKQWWQNNNIYIIKTDGSESAINLTEHLDINFTCDVLNDMGGLPEVTSPIWSNDGKNLLVQLSKHGVTKIVCLDIETRKIEPIFEKSGVIGTISIDNSQKHLAGIFTSFSSIGQIVVKNIKKQKDVKILAEPNQSLIKQKNLGQLEEVWFKGAAGNDLQGWILRPPNFDATQQYPSILEIHGGPILEYGNTFMHEFYYLAAQGYVVYFCNPRGGQGYGEAHTQAIWNNWGGPDYADLMAWTDWIAKLPYIDTDRMGVTGGSYGGYMTNWIIGHTHRFKAAVTQRCASNLISMWGTSDVNYVFQDIFGNQPPFASAKSLANYWHMSPIKYMSNVRTPTLVIHSEEDYRCALEQGQQVFVALKTQGVDTEFVIFPNEPHGLSRNGRTDRRIARLEHITRWFDKYLKK